MTQLQWLTLLQHDAKRGLASFRNTEHEIAKVSLPVFKKFSKNIKEVERDHLILFSRIVKLRMDVEKGVGMQEKDRTDIVETAKLCRKKFKDLTKKIKAEMKRTGS